MFYRTIIGLILGAISLSSNAIDLTKVSVGASFGNIKYDSEMTSESIKGKESAFSLIGQYDLKDNFNVELSLSSLGEYTFDTHSTKYSALTASIVAKTDVIKGFQPYAKLGYGLMTMTQKIVFLDSELENKTTGDTLLAGVGVGYKNEHLSNFIFRVSYDYYYFKTRKLISAEESNNNLSGFSLGVLYHFD